MRTSLIFTTPEVTGRSTDHPAISRLRRRSRSMHEELKKQSRLEEPNTCFSAKPHEQAIDDPVRHYFGCIEIHKRPLFFNKSDQLWQHEGEVEIRKLRSARNDDYPSVSRTEGDSILSLERKMKERIMRERMISIAHAIEEQYRRTDTLREALKESQSSNKASCLIANIERSRDKWVGSRKSKLDIRTSQTGRVRKGKRWYPSKSGMAHEDIASNRTEPGRAEVQSFLTDHRIKPNNVPIPEEMEEEGGTDMAKRPIPEDNKYNLERDVKAHFIQFKVKHRHISPVGDTEVFLAPIDGTLPGSRFNGTFPDHNISMSLLLDGGLTNALRGRVNNPKGEWNVLSRNYDNGGKVGPRRKIRYFHIPVNNMQWVERAITNYYEEDYSDLWRSGFWRQTPAHRLTSPELWRGQQKDTHSSHTIHMRSLCESVASYSDENKTAPHNIVLFMPYLHLDTNRSAEVISEIIKDKVIVHQASLNRKNHNTNEESSSFESNRETVHTSKPFIDDSGRVRVNNALGQYFLDAARIYEAMSAVRDWQMVEEYLFHDAPFHPRRTLRQWNNRGFSHALARDKDQVIYQETSPDTELHRKHHLSEQGHTSVFERGTGHNHSTYDKNCKDCKRNVKKVSRIVMVDQLWMWVLDGHTIITSFPQTSQENAKHNIRDVHEAIRSRLSTFMNTEAYDRLQSVYEVALIVIDEACSALLDRTKLDRQIHVLDIFSTVIERARRKHMLLRDYMWHWFSRAGKVFRDTSKFVDSSVLHIPLLENTAEMTVQQQLRGVIDDLEIMCQIQFQQVDLVKRFKKHALDNLIRNQSLGGTSQQTGFKARYDGLFRKLEEQLRELQELRKRAESIAVAMDDLVSQKQQQATLVQVWESMRQADETTSQGSAILMFTIVTIIFVPLSFISSIFGMNNVEFTKDPMTLGEQFRLMFSISFAIIFLTITVAFSNPLRGVVWAIYKYLSTATMVFSGLYYHARSWRKEGLKPHRKLIRDTEMEITKMKEEVQEERKRMRQGNPKRLHKERLDEDSATRTESEHQRDHRDFPSQATPIASHLGLLFRVFQQPSVADQTLNATQTTSSAILQTSVHSSAHDLQDHDHSMSGAAPAQSQRQYRARAAPDECCRIDMGERSSRELAHDQDSNPLNGIWTSASR